MAPVHLQLVNSTLRRVIDRLHGPLEVMLVWVRWYAAEPSSLRHLEEMMAERGVVVDHAAVHRRALKMLPVLARCFDPASDRSAAPGAWIGLASGWAGSGRSVPRW